VRVGSRRVRVRQADLDEFLKLGAKSVAEEQAPQATSEEELLSRKALADRLERSVAWVDARVRDGMPNEPPSADNPHRRFRLAEVTAWLEQRAASPPPRKGDHAERGDMAQLANALADATSAAHAGDQAQLGDALRTVANAAERLADALERAAEPS
jgi:hypothetical protein